MIMEEIKIKRAGNGGIFPPEDKQFGKPNGNPRHNGGWKKEDTPRYQLEQLLKMDVEELKAIAEDQKRSAFSRRVAKMIVSDEWKTLEGMINQVYGQPKQPIGIIKDCIKVEFVNSENKQ